MKTDLLYIEHILECIRKVEAYVGTDFGEAARSAFESNPMAQDAVVRNLQVLAESAGRISRDNQLSEPAIPWPQVRGFRKILVHQYLEIDLDFIWDIVAEDLPVLKAHLARLRAHVLHSEST